MTAGDPARVLVADGDRGVCRLVEGLVRSQGQTVAAGTAREANAVLDRPGEWSAIVVDAQLPDGCGLDVLQRARLSRPRTPALVMTRTVRRDVLNRAYDLGAQCVIKPARRERLQRFLNAAVSARPSLEACVDRVVMERSLAAGLSSTEADVLRRSALGQTRDQIALARGTSEHTIRTQIGRILAKTGHGSLFAAVGDILRDVAQGP